MSIQPLLESSENRDILRYIDAVYGTKEIPIYVSDAVNKLCTLNIAMLYDQRRINTLLWKRALREVNTERAHEMHESLIEINTAIAVKEAEQTFAENGYSSQPDL